MNIINKYNSKNNVDKIKKQIINIDNNIESLNTKIETTYMDKLEGLITKEMYNKIYNSLITNINRLEENKKELIKKINNQKNINYVKKVKYFLNNINSLLINNLIDKIEIDEDKNVSIFYKYKLS